MPTATTLPSTAAQASKTGLLKRITTKLRTPQPTASTSTAASPEKASGNKPKRRHTLLPHPKAPAPSLPNTFISAEQREAALLARGLVPRRLRDANGDVLPMSAQEAALDERFSVLLDSDVSGSESDGSEARRIREEWLARNAAALATAACGTRTFAAERRASDEELARSRTSLSAAAADEGGVVIGTPAVPHRPRIIRSHEPPPLSPSQAELASAAPSPVTGANADTDSLSLDRAPADIPLPPSPALSASALAQWGADAEIPDAEALDIGEGTTEASPARETVEAGAGAHGYRAHTVALENCDAPANAPVPAKGDDDTGVEGESPAMSSPPLSFDDPRSPRGPALTLVSTPPVPITRGRSMGSGSPTSSAPALSPTRTMSSAASTADVPQTPLFRADSAARVRSASLTSSESGARDLPKIRTGDAKGALSEVIVESPTEDDADVVPELPAPRARTLSTQTEQTERKRGFFKRNSTTSSQPAQKTKPMGGLRRSVTGTISGKLGLRPKSTLVVDTALAAKASAPSPVSPLSAPAPAHTRLDVPRPRATAAARQPLSPTMHTRGSIILYAGEIEDEESRRLAEAAFLDF